MRKGKHYMEIRGIDDLCPAFVDPDFFGECLTTGAITVAAGVIVQLCMSAVITYADVAAESF